MESKDIKLGNCPASIMVEIDTIFIENGIEIVNLENPNEISEKLIHLTKNNKDAYNEIFELLTGVKDYDFYNKMDMGKTAELITEYVKKCQGAFLGIFTVAGLTRAK